MLERKISILAIEDEPDLRRSIAAYLFDSGFKVLEAQDGLQGIELFEQEQPDLVLTDLMMPGMDGFAVITEIRRQNPDVPIVVISGAGLASDAIRAVRCGAWDYITKPIADFLILEKTLREALQRAEQRQQELSYNKSLHGLVDSQAKELLISEEKYRELVEQANTVILRMTPLGEVTFVNECAEKLFGFSRDEIKGRNVLGTIIPETESGRRDLAALMESIAERPDDFRLRENENIRKDGDSLWIRWSNRPVYDDDGSLVELLCVGQDMTEHRLLEQQVIQQQKLEGIGLLAGGIAHDFNNMLTPILGHAELICMEVNPGNKLHEHASSILAAAGKAKELVRQLLSFSRKQELSSKHCDLNEVVASFMLMLQRMIRENIEISRQLCPDSCPVHADRTQVEQILLNLAVNAQDAISANGRITIETGHLAIDDEYCALHPGAVSGRYVLLALTDSGCGMDDATLSHIFEPFFTTKAVGHGTGLGLSTVYGIVKQHNGYIDVQSRPGQGTTFRIYLPEVSGYMEEAAIPIEKPGLNESAAATILLVEDNPMVMDVAMELLVSRGHKVLTADRPEEALLIAAKHRESINMLVSDVVMPEMNGMELHGRLLEIIPGLKVLFMSGYANSVVVSNGSRYGVANFIMKPFTSDEFIRKVTDLL